MQAPGNRPDHRDGFTLLELIVVITIIGLLGTVVAVSVIPVLEDAYATKVKADLNGIVKAAKMVHLRKGSPPYAIEELELEQFPLDPWGNPYIYELRDGKPVAICLGRDQQEGGEGQDADWMWPPETDR